VASTWILLIDCNINAYFPADLFHYSVRCSCYFLYHFTLLFLGVKNCEFSVLADYFRCAAKNRGADSMVHVI
jgi:hypothetical protein